MPQGVPTTVIHVARLVTVIPSAQGLCVTDWKGAQALLDLRGPKAAPHERVRGLRVSQSPYRRIRLCKFCTQLAHVGLHR